MSNNHGGAREGAGRKKAGNAVLYCRMPQATVAEIKRRASEKKTAVGNYIMKELNLIENER